MEEIIKLERIDIKRFYAPVIIKGVCPVCGKKCEINLKNDYLSYPEGEETVEIYCENCDEFFNSTTTIEIVARIRKN